MTNPRTATPKGTQPGKAKNKPGNKGSTNKRTRDIHDENDNPGTPKRVNAGGSSKGPATATGGNRGGHRLSSEDLSGDEILRKFNEMKKELEKAKAANVALQDRLNDTSDARENDEAAMVMVAKPKGTAGTTYSIQVEMGLAGSKKKNDQYKAIQRVIRDLTLASRIDWEKTWAEIPLRDKANLLDVAREQIPFLRRFVNDWATKDLVTQYMKNKRGHLYGIGQLAVPEKYAYLKDNASKRDPSGSRKKRALSAVTMTGKQARTHGKHPGRKGKEKAPRRVPDTDDEEDEDEASATGSKGELEEEE